MPSRRFAIRALALTALIAAPAQHARADALSGSPSSMVHQHAVAVEEDYSFLRTAKDVDKLVEKGGLVPVAEGENYTLSKVAFPYARPEVKSFIEHFAAEYRAGTGNRLVVTSLTRPKALQPANAHKLSVHPAGMAVDFRVPANRDDRAFLERTLLKMEKQGVLDVTRERSPAHYHVAVFAEGWRPYAARLDSTAAADAPRRAAQRRATTRNVRPTPVASPDGRSNLMGLLLGAAVLATISVPAVRRVRRKDGRNGDRGGPPSSCHVSASQP
jgi:hypothetical protein